RSQGETNRDAYRVSWTIDSTGAPTPGGERRAEARRVRGSSRATGAHHSGCAVDERACHAGLDAGAGRQRRGTDKAGRASLVITNVFASPGRVVVTSNEIRVQLAPAANRSEREAIR